MKQNIILEKIIKKAKKVQRLRRDPRYKNTMGFLVAKGFLFTNAPIIPLPNIRLNTKDVIWAGENIEPRILEVLPAAMIRFEKHFDKTEDPELMQILNNLKKQQKDGPPFRKIEYKKILYWVNLKLADKRTKTLDEKRIPKNYRLRPEIIQKLKLLASNSKTRETDFLEKLIEQASE